MDMQCGISGQPLSWQHLHTCTLLGIGAPYFCLMLLWEFWVKREKELAPFCNRTVVDAKLQAKSWQETSSFCNFFFIIYLLTALSGSHLKLLTCSSETAISRETMICRGQGAACAGVERRWGRAAWGWGSPRKELFMAPRGGFSKRPSSLTWLPLDLSLLGDTGVPPCPHGLSVSPVSGCRNRLGKVPLGR